MTTINAIANRIGLRAEAVMVDNNPNMPDFEGDHWKVTLRRNGPRRSMTVPFSQGYAISREPDGKEVLSCLLSDAISIQGCDFEGVASWGSTQTAERPTGPTKPRSARAPSSVGS